MAGRYPEPEPEAAKKIISSTVADFLKEYRRRHCEAEKLNMDSLGSKLSVIERRFGTLELTALEKPGPTRISRPT
jgi:hypothetical protein